jgi:flagellar protein FlgJ
MLIDNPRFRGALGTGSDAHAFASGLAKGGYATDPAYAAKLSRLAGRLQGISG